MNLLSWFYYFLGYLFSIGIGQFLIGVFSNAAWSAIEDKNTRPKDSFRWTTAMVGVFERLIYTSSIVLDAKEAIAVWLAFKIAYQWRKWEGEKTDSASLAKGRAFYNLYLLGTGFSLAYGVLGGLLITWLKNKDFDLALVSIALLIFINLVYILIAIKKQRGK